MKRSWFRMLFIIAVMALYTSLSVTQAMAQVRHVNYVVQRGDTLGKVAHEYCTTWRKIYLLNRDTIGRDPNALRPGMVLIVPANCESFEDTSSGDLQNRRPKTNATGVYNAPYYTVAWGDTLSSIGQRFGIPWQNIAAANGIKGTLIRAGQSLLIPDPATGATQLPVQAPAERVYFQPGAISDTRSGVIFQGTPKSYILWGNAWQTLSVTTYSHGEPLVISISDSYGNLLPLNGVNNQLNNSVTAALPYSGDYLITVAPVTLPESPQLVFDITFVIQ